MFTFVFQLWFTATAVFKSGDNRAYGSFAFICLLGAVGCAYVTAWLGAAGYIELGRTKLAHEPAFTGYAIAVIVSIIMFLICNFLTFQIVRALDDDSSKPQAETVVIFCAIVIWLSIGSGDTFVSYKGAGLRAKNNTKLIAGRQTGVKSDTLPYASNIKALKADTASINLEIASILTQVHKGSTCKKGICKSIETSEGKGSLHWQGNLTPFGSARIKDLKEKREPLETQLTEYTNLQLTSEKMTTNLLTDQNGQILNVRAIKETVFEFASIAVYLLQLFLSFVVSHYMETKDKPRSVQTTQSAKPASPTPPNLSPEQLAKLIADAIRTPSINTEPAQDTATDSVQSETDPNSANGFPYNCTHCGVAYLSGRRINGNEKPFCSSNHRQAYWAEQRRLNKPAKNA